MLFHEPGGDKVAASLRESGRVISSRLLRLEAERAVLRFGLDRPERHKLQASLERDLRIFWPNVDFVEMTREVCELAGRIAPRSRLRSLDAIHLASYYRIKELDPSVRILTYDRRIMDEVNPDAKFPL
jgi:predicted nucleic acid-binding protein